VEEPTVRPVPEIVLALALATAAAAPARADSWEKTYRISGRPTLRLHTDDGSVRVETWDRKAVMVRVTTRGWRIGPGGVRITEQVSGDDVALEVRTRRWNFSVGFTMRSIAVEVWLPHDADVDVETGDGSVSARPLAGRIRIHTGDGSITADGLKGDLTLHTGDGSITARELDGRLDADTGDGHIRVGGRFDALELSSGDGTITAEVESGSRLARGGTITTGDGSVVLRIPQDLKADLDAHTGDGHISLDFPVEVSGELSRSTVRGALNGGGPLLKLRTGDGSIRIERL
jgi:hypothetical protein